MSIIVRSDAIDCVLIMCRGDAHFKGVVFCLFVVPAGLSHDHLPSDRQVDPKGEMDAGAIDTTGEACIYKFIHRIK